MLIGIHLAEKLSNKVFTIFETLVAKTTLSIGNPPSLGSLLGNVNVAFIQRMDLHRKNSSSVAPMI